MADLTKRQKKCLRELAAEAHERELKRELEGLAREFDRWRAGELPSGELALILHDHDDGPAKRTWAFYNNVDPGTIVARAVADGMLSLDEVPEDVRPFVERLSQMMGEFWSRE
jgi:hypothetical protein